MTQRPRPTASRRISRRTLLRRVGLVTVALGGATAGGFIVSHSRLYPDAEPATALRFLERREYAIVAALADTLFPPGNSIGLTGMEARVPEYIDRWLDGLSADKASEYRMMLLVFEHGTLAFGLRARRFTDLPLLARERYLRRWETTRVYSRRMLATALKTSLGTAYFAHPEVRASLGVRSSCKTPADEAPREEWL
ncbi:MAG TPA: hypothetical protein DIU15_07670 [Deltaproteobacteria bacterium]|nr:hypothetical protein [Deltaproteobacteria bacterium]